MGHSIPVVARQTLLAQESTAMAEADVRLTTVPRDGCELDKLIPNGCMDKAEGKSALPGEWEIANVAGTVTLSVTGNSVTSKEKPFGNLPLMAEIDETASMLGLHINLGGSPMKAWMKQNSGLTELHFSNGGKWTKKC